jgi:hypothetical protein
MLRKHTLAGNHMDNHYSYVSKKITGAIFKAFQFGQVQGGLKISTAGIVSAFRELKFSINVEIGRNGAF